MALLSATPTSSRVSYGMPQSLFKPILSINLWWCSYLDILQVRLAVTSIYSGRKGELAQLSSKDIYLDGEQSYIYITTTKRGVRKKQRYHNH